MEQYSFHDLDINERGDPAFLPPEALFIIQNGIGIPIEDMIDGYQTLNVSGRELISRELNTIKVNGVNGTMFESASYPQRDITVTYLLEARSDQEFREKFQKLNSIISPRQFSFYFFDDFSFKFTGTLSNAEKVEPGSNTVRGEFTITCTDPFKRAKEPTVYSGKSITILEPMDFEVVPDKIQFRFAQESSAVAISNGKHTIALTRKFKVGDVLILNPNQSEIIVNNNYSLYDLNLDSDFENFTVITGTQINASVDGELEVTVRKKAL